MKSENVVIDLDWTVEEDDQISFNPFSVCCGGGGGGGPGGTPSLPCTSGGSCHSTDPNNDRGT